MSDTGPPTPPAETPPQLSFWHPAALVSTWGGTGLLPAAPGTWGSLAALPLAWAIAERFGPWGLAAAALLLVLIGLWTASIYLRHAESRDPSEVVIDEVAGQMVALLPAVGDPLSIVLGFVFFRTFDILKPWPVSALERKLKGAAGVVADDIAAGTYAAGCMILYYAILGRPNALF